MKILTTFVLSFLSIYLCAASDILVLSMVIGDEYSELVKRAVENKQAYCQKHGYDFICLNRSLDNTRPIPWSKILFIKSIMKKYPSKWIFWTDADSLFMDFSRRLEEFVDEEHNLIITRDLNAINSGQFFLKNCDWSYQFLKVVYDHTEYIHHHWWENQGFIHEIENTDWVSKKVKILPQRVFNSYAQEEYGLELACYYKGDFIIHFAGVRGVKLREYLEKYSDMVIGGN
jgi:hypothetical protein